ncbi:hypothetical protein SAMN05216516_10213 [Izhakiella capsodis]|uniref:Uncharacterized protein n=1 Tax=Izhakiella capsodis TaxID=1367852 RepID=A0A1I4VRJ5_9GAMM|nr:hypothetical protein SAMN05216516_10213 [Izhakiella capsodis]
MISSKTELSDYLKFVTQILFLQFRVTGNSILSDCLGDFFNSKQYDHLRLPIRTTMSVQVLYDKTITD